ncbi:hypothetical protein [Okeania sp. SIO1I7]|uniref:hypothetical protein n=1 Tax=Okeania sp. SIO1I7 TaxID=2607772 RepID=UPI0013FA05CC|nr:hypothetical protein [Okeania sp. SIO1I7]NET25123.1 hypothetical protein [Okeania sp. SIO1I7]
MIINIGDFFTQEVLMERFGRGKQIFLGAFHHENISAIAFGKIPEYFDCLLV